MYDAWRSFIRKKYDVEIEFIAQSRGVRLSGKELLVTATTKSGERFCCTVSFPVSALYDEKNLELKVFSEIEQKLIGLKLREAAKQESEIELRMRQLEYFREVEEDWKEWRRWYDNYSSH